MEARSQIQDLIERAQTGDGTALDELVLAHRTRLEAFLRTRLGPHLRERVEVDDAVQETLTRAFRSLERFEWRGEDSFFRWLSSIAEFVVRDLARRHRRQGPAPLDREPPGTDASPSQIVRREERFDRLRRSVESLSPDYREVVDLVCLKGISVKEVAERMGKSPGAIRNLLLRATRKLRGTFGETESLHLPERSLEIGGPGDDE